MSFNDYWQAEHQRRAVEEAMRSLKAGDAATQKRFAEQHVDALRQATLLFPVESLPEGLQRGDLFQAEPGRSVQIKAIKSKEGQAYFPLFTSEAEFSTRFDAGQPFLLISFVPYARMALRANAGIVINPHSETRAVLLPPALKALAQPAPQPAGADQQLRIVPPTRQLTFRELAILQDWLAQRDDVRQAYLFGLMQRGQGALTLGLDLLEPKDKAAMEALARELHTVFGPLLLIPLDARSATAVTHLPTAIHFDLRA